MKTIDLNMVGAGVVAHPEEWKWTGYSELVGDRKRYRLVDASSVHSSLATKNAEYFQWGIGMQFKLQWMRAAFNGIPSGPNRLLRAARRFRNRWDRESRTANRSTLSRMSPMARRGWFKNPVQLTAIFEG